MTSPPEPPQGVNIITAEPAGVTLGPDMFYWDNPGPSPATQPNEPLPRAWAQGGMIESVKRAVITGLRESFAEASMLTDLSNEKYYIDIEYPTDITNYPAIWVQFAIESLSRAGLGMETWVQDPATGGWTAIQEWMFNGRITLTIAALSSKDRDRLADSVIAHLAFSRPPDLVIRNKQQDTKQYRGLITTLENNPFVRMTLNLDQINSGGQTVTNGVPWAQNILLYEDNYAVTCQGQFNMQFSNDGVYTLNAINAVPSLLSDNVAYNPAQWLGTVNPNMPADAAATYNPSTGYDVPPAVSV